MYGSGTLLDVLSHLQYETRGHLVVWNGDLELYIGQAMLHAVILWNERALQYHLEQGQEIYKGEVHATRLLGMAGLNHLLDCRNRDFVEQEKPWRIERSDNAPVIKWDQQDTTRLLTSSIMYELAIRKDEP